MQGGEMGIMHGGPAISPDYASRITLDSTLYHLEAGCSRQSSSRSRALLPERHEGSATSGAWRAHHARSVGCWVWTQSAKQGSAGALAWCISICNRIFHFCTHVTRDRPDRRVGRPHAEGGWTRYRACSHQALEPQVGRRRPCWAASDGSLSGARTRARSARVRMRHIWGTRYLGNGFELCEWTSCAHTARLGLCAREVPAVPE